MSEFFDFSSIDSASSTSYLKPGQYEVSIKEVKFEKPVNKTPYINVTFVTKEGGQVTEKFFVTPKALNRLQYLAEGWTGKRVEKGFTSLDEIGAFFEKYLTAKQVTRKLVVGGQESEDGTRVFAGLPYSGFILPDNVPFEAGEYTKDNPRYAEVVRKAQKTAASGTNRALLGDDSGIPTSGSTSSEDAPW